MKIQVAEYAAGVTVQNVYLANVLGPLNPATGSNPCHRSVWSGRAMRRDESSERSARSAPGGQPVAAGCGRVRPRRAVTPQDRRRGRAAAERAGPTRETFYAQTELPGAVEGRLAGRREGTAQAWTAMLGRRVLCLITSRQLPAGWRSASKAARPWQEPQPTATTR